MTRALSTFVAKARRRSRRIWAGAAAAALGAALLVPGAAPSHAAQTGTLKFHVTNENSAWGGSLQLVDPGAKPDEFGQYEGIPSDEAKAEADSGCNPFDPSDPDDSNACEPKTDGKWTFSGLKPGKEYKAYFTQFETSNADWHITQFLGSKNFGIAAGTTYTVPKPGSTEKTIEGTIASLTEAPVGELTVTGGSTAGSTLKATVPWNGPDNYGDGREFPIRHNLTWLRDGEDIDPDRESTEMPETYALTSKDVGHKISVSTWTIANNYTHYETRQTSKEILVTEPEGTPEPTESSEPTDTATTEPTDEPSSAPTDEPTSTPTDDRVDAQVSIDSGRPGDELTISGLDSLAGTKVDVVFHSDPVTVADDVEVSAAGTVTTKVPALNPGEHSILVQSADNAKTFARLDFTVLGRPAEPSETAEPTVPGEPTETSVPEPSAPGEPTETVSAEPTDPATSEPTDDAGDAGTEPAAPGSGESGADDDGGLPRTGMELTAAGIGAVLLIGGIGLMVNSRRRRG